MWTLNIVKFTSVKEKNTSNMNTLSNQVQFMDNQTKSKIKYKC